MRSLIPVLGLLTTAACAQDETLYSYGGAGEWRLQSLHGAPVAATVTLDLPEPGKVAGRAQCNVYFGAQRAPYPWFNAGPFGVTRMACPGLDDEQRYLAALEAATISEISGDTLILTDEAGREMVFTRLPGG